MNPYLQWVGDNDEEGHELLDGGRVVHVLVDASHQLCHDAPARPYLKQQGGIRWFSSCRSIFHIKYCSPSLDISF